MEKNPDTIEVDAIHVQEVGDKNTRDKQRTKGRCFLCNKQGHLKRQCPDNQKGSCLTGAVKDTPTVRVSFISEDENQDVDTPERALALQAINKMLVKLRGMSTEEQDDVIDTLVSQEGF